MLITIDPYYKIDFYNETLEALKNNRVEYSEFISSKPPYSYYLDIPREPLLINYDKSSKEYSKWLVNVVKALKPNDDYIYRRRESYTKVKALKFYGINDSLGKADKSGEAVFFTSTKDEILRISKEYSRKIFFMGKYFKRKYKLFLCDDMMIKNFINKEQILVESDSFKMITDLEVELNYKIFQLKDRLVKLSETPYIFNGIYYPIQSVRPEISGKYSLT